eukprot:COSAG02_NODE_2068_length_9943_cov_5.977245_13_plen_152_part_00
MWCSECTAHPCVGNGTCACSTAWLCGVPCVGERASYAPHYATRERNHRLGTATGSLPAHKAPRFGRLRLPQLGAGGSRNGSVKGLDAPRGGIFLRSLDFSRDLHIGSVLTGGSVRRRAAAGRARTRDTHAHTRASTCTGGTHALRVGVPCC